MAVRHVDPPVMLLPAPQVLDGRARAEAHVAVRHVEPGRVLARAGPGHPPRIPGALLNASGSDIHPAAKMSVMQSSGAADRAPGTPEVHDVVCHPHSVRQTALLFVGASWLELVLATRHAFQARCPMHA